MTVEFDHLVYVVTDLDRAVAEFREAGHAAESGGAHDDGPTHNALVPLAGETYLELLAFRKPLFGTVIRTMAKTPLWSRFVAGRDAVTRPFVDAMGRTRGAARPVYRTDDLAGAVTALRVAGFEMDEPTEMSRKTPDGRDVRWRMAGSADLDVPTVIEDVTPRDHRIPPGSPDLPTITRVRVAVRDPGAIAAAYDALMPRATGGSDGWQAGTAVIEPVTRTAGVHPATATLSQGRVPPSAVGLS